MLPFFLAQGAVAKRLCTGLQIRVGRFDSGPRLQLFQKSSPERGYFFVGVGSMTLASRQQFCCLMDVLHPQGIGSYPPMGLTQTQLLGR